jgi:uncharacterized protein
MVPSTRATIHSKLPARIGVMVNPYRFWWDEENIEHIANHGVEPLEAEAVIEYATLIRKAGRGKYVAYGQTDSGRYLMVVYAPKENRRLRVVTARDMTPAEKRQIRSR